MQYSFKIQVFKGKLSYLTLCKYEQEKQWKPRFPGFDFGSEHNSNDFSLLKQCLAKTGPTNGIVMTKLFCLDEL